MKKIFNKSNIPVFIFVLFILAGISVMLYPSIANFINASKSEAVINTYASSISKNTASDNSDILNKAIEYNSKLSGNAIVDAFSNPEHEESQDYLNILNISNGIMGYIEIPKINVRIPIYHGTSAKVLQKGVGHLEDSSFPVGGAGTHAVLSGHRGLPSAKLFTDLDQMQNDDLFYITIIGEKLAYKVDQISVVEPSDVEQLRIQKGEDYVTLVTCTPYAVNTHRLLVRGTRVEYVEEPVKVVKVEKKLSTPDLIFYAGLASAALIIIAVIIISIRLGKKAKRKPKRKKRKDAFDII